MLDKDKINSDVEAMLTAAAPAPAPKVAAPVAQTQPATQPVVQQEQKSVVQPVTTGPSAGDDTAKKLDILLQILVSREARLAEQEEFAQQAIRARNAQREKSSSAHFEKQLVKQARCRHMKGGKLGPISGVTNYAVYMHTYINGESIIKCMICQMKWKAQDTVDFLVRGGRRIANHTRIGWREATAMTAQSTNQPSSSEVPYQVKPVADFNGVEVI